MHCIVGDHQLTHSYTLISTMFTPKGVESYVPTSCFPAPQSSSFTKFYVLCRKKVQPRMYPVEYAKSSRAACKLCELKIAKGQVRIGKQYTMALAMSSVAATAWYHKECFWSRNKDDRLEFPGSNTWRNFSGTSSLSLEDQQEMHLKVTGRAMELQVVEKVVEQKEKAEAAAVFTDSSPSTILYTMLQKHLDLLKVPELKAACEEHGLQLDKKAKRVNIVKMIMDQEIGKVSGLVYQGLKKNCTAQDLKDILKNAGLAVSGSKEDLLRRLLENQGSAPPSASQVAASEAVREKEKKEEKKKRKRDYDGYNSDGDYFSSRHDIYKEDEVDSDLVKTARSGGLESLLAELDKLPKKDGSSRAAKLNHARRWTEVEEKWGYDKSWEWFGDTALTAAARRGEAEIVRALLVAGADPTLQACPSSDVTETAVQAAETARTRAEAAVKEVEEARVPSYGLSMQQRPGLVARSLLARLGSATTSLALLHLALAHWPVAGYTSVHFSQARKTAFKTGHNSPREAEKMKQELESCHLGVEVDEGKLQELTLKYEKLQGKRKEEQEEELARQRERMEKDRQQLREQRERQERLERERQAQAARGLDPHALAFRMDARLGAAQVGPV